MKQLIKVLCVVLAVAGSVWAQTTVWYTANPSAEIFYISTRDDLRGLAQLVNGGTTNFSGKTIVLQENITLTVNHTSIGSNTRQFLGIFDGNGKSISNVSAVYFFGYVGADGQIKNLVLNSGGGLAETYASTKTIENCGVNIKGTFSSSSGAIGGLVGTTTEILTINNSYTTGNVSSSNSTAGGLVGDVSAAITINNSYTTGNISSSNSFSSTGVVSSGGLVGSVGSSAILIINNSYATGNVSATSISNDNNSFPFSGGLLGRIAGDVTINNSYATGDVSSTASTATSSYSGGLIGIGLGITINNSYAIGNVSASSASQVRSGGLVGQASGSSNIKYSYASGTITATGSGTKYIGGIYGWYSSGTNTSVYYNSAGASLAAGRETPTGISAVSLVELKQQGTFANWNFENIWAINPNINDGMPYLQCIHLWREWSDWDIAEAATCETAGSEERTRVCNICGKIDTETEEIEKLGHLLNWQVTTIATCETKGEETGTCTREDCGHSEKREIPQLTDGCNPSSINDIRKSDKKHGIMLTKNLVSDIAEMKVVLPNGEKVVEAKTVAYDNAGNVVFETATRSSKVIWNLRNSAGREVANGTYLVVAEVKGVSGKTYAYSTKVGVKR
jgi:hypothetical protein